MKAGSHFAFPVLARDRSVLDFVNDDNAFQRAEGRHGLREPREACGILEIEIVGLPRAHDRARECRLAALARPHERDHARTAEGCAYAGGKGVAGDHAEAYHENRASDARISWLLEGSAKAAGYSIGYLGRRLHLDSMRVGEAGLVVTKLKYPFVVGDRNQQRTAGPKGQAV